MKIDPEKFKRQKEAMRESIEIFAEREVLHSAKESAEWAMGHLPHNTHGKEIKLNNNANSCTPSSHIDQAEKNCFLYP